MQIENDGVTRRTFLAGAGALAAASLVNPRWAAADTSIASLGEWLDDDHGLPCYHYTGPLRFADSPQRDGDPMIPDDPFFLLGNYRLTLFAHASGLYQIVTGERVWGRMNQGDAGWSGANQATVEFGGEKHELVGLDSAAALAANKHFGVGLARYEYRLGPSLKITRRLSVAPSPDIKSGTSAFLLEVRFRNTGSQPLQLRYTETTRVRYQQLFSKWDDGQHEVSWTPATPVESGDLVQAGFTAHAKHLLTFPPAGQMCRYEQFPPTLFVKALGGGATRCHAEDAAGFPCLGITGSLTVRPNEEDELAFIVGYTREISNIENLCASLHPASSARSAAASAFADAWRQAIPAFASESDVSLRREMRWNAAVLEAMATWREYYKETVIPQGTMYDYIWGAMASSRDLAQQALPFCHTNPAIARSTLRFLMKRSTPDGEIKLGDEGYGWNSTTPQQTSDQQLYFFLLLAEYLRVTGDASVLSEQIGYYPLENSGHDTDVAHVRQAFLFLRDRVGVGAHGIVRRWNSDWNDMFGWWQSPIPYNTEFQEGESHMNSAMAVVILGDLATVIDSHDGSASDLAAAMREYRAQLQQAFMRDLGDRAFPRRAWMDYKNALGEDEMWLEPQGYTLLIPEFGVERKRKLFDELQHRLLAGEAMGPRQVERPAANAVTPPGSRENGGFWYALNGPVVLGVASFDPAAADDLLRRMSFANYAKHFPDYWTGRWSASDSLDSSLLKTSGLSTAIPYCAHSHAWPLYCYLRLRTGNSS